MRRSNGSCRCGRLEILVNSAAIVRDRTVQKMSDDEWRAVIDITLAGAFNVCRAAMPYFAERGRIVNVTSISGLLGLCGQANYAAACVAAAARRADACATLAGTHCPGNQPPRSSLSFGSIDSAQIS